MQANAHTHASDVKADNDTVEAAARTDPLVKV